MLVGIIPARYNSSRFPGKPLAKIEDKSMIQRVYEQAEKPALFDILVVATDDQRIREHVEAYGGRVVMTADNHKSGTSRCAEVAANYPDDSVIINIQGDEPFINQAQLKLLAELMQNKNIQIATLIKKIDDYSDLLNPNVVKVVVDNSFKALYFSRQQIPYVRDSEANGANVTHAFYKHIGLYAYRGDVLKKISCLPATPLSEAENLEQLNWLENSFNIFTAITEHNSIGIDTPEDIARAIAFLKSKDDF